MTEWEMEASKRASEDARKRERAGEEGEREVRPNESEPRAGDVACVAASSFQRQREREARTREERTLALEWNKTWKVSEEHACTLAQSLHHSVNARRDGIDLGNAYSVPTSHIPLPHLHLERRWMWNAVPYPSGLFKYRSLHQSL